MRIRLPDLFGRRRVAALAAENAMLVEATRAAARQVRRMADETAAARRSAAESERLLHEAHGLNERLHAELDRARADLESARESASYLMAERDEARELATAATGERDRLRGFVETLSSRCAAQSQILSRSAEADPEVSRRVAELEEALGPLSEILSTGWDDGTLPADALYPVRMGDLRRLSRAMAGTLPPG